jgi:hypothetical protein
MEARSEPFPSMDEGVGEWKRNARLRLPYGILDKHRAACCFPIPGRRILAQFYSPL